MSPCALEWGPYWSSDLRGFTVPHEEPGVYVVSDRQRSCCWILIGVALALGLSKASADSLEINITQHHNHASRDGLYVDPAFTRAAVANLKRDFGFDGTISGHVYAQPLYLDNGPGGRAAVIVVTESNNAYALDAADGSIIWQKNVGSPVRAASLPCGDIDPLGITGTPVIDLPSRTVFFDAMTTPDNGATVKHLIFALNLDAGTVHNGWPVDVNTAARFGATVFTSLVQNQRGALATVGSKLYVPYGGLAGDCGVYHGWLLGVALDNPADVTAWATAARGGGAWAVGGVATDGISPFIATGNTFGASSWSGGEAIIRFEPGPIFSNLTVDYWSPPNWQALDSSDIDIGGSGPVLLDLPGGTPSSLVAAFGKDGNMYLLNRTNLGGVSQPVAQAHVSSSAIIQAAAAYRTAQGAYVVFCGNSGQSQLSAIHIGAGNPPTLASAWSQSEGGRGSPFVTSTDGTNNVTVWGLGCEGDQRLHGFDGDTGATVYSGGGPNEVMAGTRRFQTGIAAHGRIYVAADNRVYAFTLPVSPLVLTSATLLPTGAFQLAFTNMPGMSFSTLTTSDVSVPLASWTRLGPVPEVSPGHFQFTDLTATNYSQRFYSVRSP